MEEEIVNTKKIMVRFLDTTGTHKSKRITSESITTVTIRRSAN